MLFPHSALQFIEPSRRVGFPVRLRARATHRIDFVAQLRRVGIAGVDGIAGVADRGVRARVGSRKNGFQLGRHLRHVSLRQRELGFLREHALPEHFDTLRMHLLVFGRDVDRLAIIDAFGELLATACRFELALLSCQTLARLVEPAAEVVQAHSRLNERLFHARRHQAPLFGARGAGQQVVERAAKALEHHRRLAQDCDRLYDTGRVRNHATEHAAMTFAPFVIVTATTEPIRGIPRVRVNEAYTNALTEAGLIPMILPPIDPTLAVASLRDVAGLVLTGGEDIDPSLFGEAPHPATAAPHAGRDAYELALARAAHEMRIPTFAICRGAQILNVALGGSLVQDIPSEEPSDVEHAPADKRAERVHSVDIESGSRLARIVGAEHIRTNSSHHQSVRRVAPELHVTARSEDGIIEALEARDPAWWAVAVQWHPEELTNTPENWDRRLFAAYGAAVREAGRD